jgi:ribulose-phosphate 3-epimerase
MAKCSVSLWSADLTNLGQAVRDLEGYADYLHFDVSDGHYTPEMLFFPDLLRSLRPLTNTPFDVHIMACQPEKFVETFADSGADLITIQYEPSEDPLAALKLVKELGKQAGIALQPDTPISVVEPLVDQVDVVLILGTKIGVKGQDMIPETYDRIRELRKLLQEKGREEVEIMADGAIRTHTVEKLVEAGADILVPGSLVFGNNIAETINWLHSLTR